ncbi:MAG: 1-acyl-sn-glycerol-3-phosphate acyltransferase [Phycisphaerae bacterium]|nr:1-acyl-sn-glycerol-3-phosphate acyltransferase [Phycisphaerae bacterium]
MQKLPYTNGVYRTQPGPLSVWARLFPSLAFYPRFMWIVFQASRKSKRGEYDNPSWCHSSLGILRALESVGVRVVIEGTQNLEGFQGPCVIVANHMSMLETVVLPILVQPIRDCTFVVKQDLLEYPVFRHVMRSRDPIPVTRVSPREDLKAVLEGGEERLRRGISIILFPQTTRMTVFDPAQFNSIGVKLAHRAKVPIVPLALRTHAWENGRRLKDFGRIDRSRTVHFAFGPSLEIRGRGQEEHQAIMEFIQDRLRAWEASGG